MTTRVVLAALAFVVIAVGALGDRALIRQSDLVGELEATRAQERVRLVALSVRATLARLEETLAVKPDEALTAFRLPRAPRLGAAVTADFASKSRHQLREMLPSLSSTQSGLPVAALAALALQDVSEMDAIAERILSGDLPVDAKDLPGLMSMLGHKEDPRLAILATRLREAPGADALPWVPNYARELVGNGRVMGWARSANHRHGYEIDVRELLRIADAGGVEIQGSSAGTRPTAKVPDVAGFSVAVQPDESGTSRIRVLRLVLWLAISLSVLLIAALERTTARERRAICRERDFLSNVTHELRTPLASLQLLGETLAAGRGEPQEYGTLIFDETARLQLLAERALSAARGDEKPVLSRVSVTSLLRTVLNLVQPRAERNGVELTTRLDEDLPSVMWDEELVRGALMNLIDNAIKHGGNHVMVTGRRSGAAIRLSVSDDGPGVRKSLHRSIFKRFARGDSHSAGTGLGLYLAERVARAHGGRIELESPRRRGCTFTLTLPIAQDATS